MGRTAKAALAGALVAAAAVVSTPSTAGATERVIVQADAGGLASATRAVTAAGGRVTLALPIVNGFAAEVPAAAAARLRNAEGVRAVTPDAEVTVQATTSSTVNPTSINSVYARETGADQLWAEGITGNGVTVALVDTGVSASPDLAGRVVTDVPDPTNSARTDVCANFAGDGTCDDRYGHGTFLAGLIAGNGAGSAGMFRGIAPGARIVSVKVAGYDGSSDVSKVLAAIQYVVSFREQLGIDVLNLSLGTNSTQSYAVDPLNHAVEQAWQSGITVVVAAGNLGPAPGTISKPGDDPFVITAGSVDDRETPARDDDRVPNFSSRGPTAADGLAKPDLVAPGARLVSLRASQGNYVDTFVGGGVNATYRRGSGTSMSAAVVSGIAALVLDANETWSPNRVKHALTTTASRTGLTAPTAVGAGLVQAYAAARRAPAGEANLGLVAGNGTGSLDASRGDVEVSGPCQQPYRTLDPTCTKPLEGDETAQGRTYEAEQWGTSWYESQWAEAGPLGTSWYGTSWYGTSWYGTSWYGTSWYGASWEGGTDTQTRYGKPADGGAWYGAWE
ncbi:MAG TPA: S8 family peptidase [Acidimicrobiales bacterium]|nr:S8 family peptidase [Acidimicrobiales bacterium]